MAPPPLKRQKTNPTTVPPAQAQAQAANVPLPPESPTALSTTKPATSNQGDHRASWITRTWPRKARPLAEVARESVSSASNALQEVASVTKDRVRPQRSPSLAMALGKTTSNRSLPVDATTTTVNATAESATPNGKRRPQGASDSNDSKTKEEPATELTAPNGEQKPDKEDSSEPALQPAAPDTTSLSSEQAQNAQASWLGWLARRDGSVAHPPDTQPAPGPNTPATTAATTAADNTESGIQPEPETTQQEAQGDEAGTNKRSWYQMWNGGEAPSTPSQKDQAPATAASVPTSKTAESAEPASNVDIPASSTSSKPNSQASSIVTSAPPPLSGDGSKSSGWVFWSRDKKVPSATKSDNDPHVGEIAISDTPSQAKPKRASISLDDEAKPVLKLSLQEDRTRKATSDKVATPKLTPVEQLVAQPAKHERKTSTVKDGSTTKAESSNATAVAREPIEIGTPRRGSPAPSKIRQPDLLLPPLKETLTYEEQPSIIQQLARLLYYTKEPHLKHLHLVRDPPRIQNALAIGVHGYFPAPLIRSVLGQPTGTSIKFADMAAKCIKKWTKDHGYECEVKSAALEGEGRIAERVELLWKLLLNWIDEIRKSDFVMVACHSQGVPVAIMLVAKLIQFGCVSAARVGICAMAGVNLGPFQEYKSRWISGSAGELFEFSNPNSKVSSDYLEAMEVVLKFGVRLTFAGSIDDQLVSMESSTFAPLTHPHIYRAVFIDSRVHAPNFLSHLVGFVLKLRNVGVPDHGLIRELSTPLAGSLYGGEGHSRIYEDDAVYDVAIAFALETNALKDVPISKRQTNNTTANPYVLPFAMRGILEEDYVKTELQNEAQQLLAQFDDWKPTTKALRDVKFRLEGIRSKL
ncbi:hypothetical protein EDD37DRAFT_186914 [Exophiala viscosa]|uniref:YMC020W-like alpha/beta hydrolase domain-containing protein n=1 Tax=Exophiala viscosa TaxID=2486360 RepID=A0AAN6IA09_9EURO|nr:hypothetical protein EDD36DRAFT_448936 [Exophiala viscosa]KAI1620120.1 hypothetical protein EDD37DRAFT_186914 [Exophiala viscosa]